MQQPQDNSLNIIHSEHACGDCTACCSRLPISAGIVSPEQKLAGTDCPHQCSSGCSIYQDRPSICQSFECSWITQKNWEAGWRPDHVGLLCLEENLSETCKGAAIYEIRRGALSTPDGIEIFQQIKKRTDMVVLIYFNGTRHTIVKEPTEEKTKSIIRPLTVKGRKSA
ncbi:MAG: hypothetical protein COA78_31475 [Blastopirellula sp.]|nr:MAG: hypothetical protein COA78_31475 [Blastopirellula sp.]